MAGTQAPREKSGARSRVSVLTFNSNNANICDEELKLLLNGASGSDILILSFQEYDVCPESFVPQETSMWFGAIKGGYLKVMPYDRSSYCRLSEDHEAKMKSADADRLSRIRGMIGSDFKLIADVAQGEPAVLIKPKVEGEKKLEWYGFIRLMVFSKLESPGAVHTCVVPCGSKKTSMPVQGPYEAGMSPDKGGVAAWIPAYGLLVTSMHLTGTNSNEKNEDYFDKDRAAQFEIMHSALCDLTKDPNWHNLSPVSLFVCCGDLNFRVSKYLDPARRKEELAEVMAVADDGDDKANREMFTAYDRLSKLMDGTSISPTPAMLEGCKDAVREVAEDLSTPMIRPTFTYPIPDGYDPTAPVRRHKDKRTPSWTDRVLWRGHDWALCRTQEALGGGAPNGERLTCYADRRVTCSDHEPVLVIVEGPRLKSDVGAQASSGAGSGSSPYVKSLGIALSVSCVAYTMGVGPDTMGVSNGTASLILGCAAFVASLLIWTDRQ